MTHTVFVDEKNISFECAGDETILDAAERAGFTIPYSCRKGVCASCEGSLVAGTAMVRGQGRRDGPCAGVRLCQARPTSDITIAPTDIRRADIPVRKVLRATVFRITQAAPDVVILNLRYPIGRRARFKAGQYLRVLMPNGDSRNYSLANTPARNDGAELHIRVQQGGSFSEGVLSRLEPGDSLDVEVPYGNFGLAEGDGNRAILLATGTGFAPIYSILRDLVARGATRRVNLYWGGRKELDLYAWSEIAKLANTHDWFSATPVLSRPSVGWTGRTGYVHSAAIEDFPNMSACSVHACGSPEMVEAAQHELTQVCGLPTEYFFSDAFVPSAET